MIPFKYIISFPMTYDHHWTPDEKKIKNEPKTESQKLFLVSSIKSRKLVTRQKKILKFHEKANACSSSNIKYDQKLGRNSVLTSLTGNPITTGAFSPPKAAFFMGMPNWYCDKAPGVATDHSSILMNLAFPAMTDPDSPFSKRLSQLAIEEV